MPGDTDVIVCPCPSPIGGRLGLDSQSQVASMAPPSSFSEALPSTASRYDTARDNIVLPSVSGVARTEAYRSSNFDHSSAEHRRDYADSGAREHRSRRSYDHRSGKSRRPQHRRPRRRPYFRARPGHLPPPRDGAPMGASDGKNLKPNLEEWDLRMKLRKEKPFAPRNTTQFLMDDQNVRSPDYNEITRMIRSSHKDHQNKQNPDESFEMGSDSESEYYSSPDDEQDFLQRQFSETYDNIHAERMSSMSRSELVQEYMALEERVDDLERKLKEARGQESSSIRFRSYSDSVHLHGDKNLHFASSPSPHDQEVSRKVQQEVQRLHEENEKLRKDNEQLRDALGSCSKSTADSVSSSAQEEDAKPSSSQISDCTAMGSDELTSSTTEPVAALSSEPVTNTDTIMEASMDSMV
ncbi:Protein HEXIM2 [Halotydeus destructor]|nr:Protein HEXIM2 [Halotydeus destructor]